LCYLQPRYENSGVLVVKDLTTLISQGKEKREMKKYTEFKSAQSILEDIYGDNVTGFMIGGFNHFLEGYHQSDFDIRTQSVATRDLAIKLINDGSIFYVEPFKCKCGSSRYTYGGKWACDDCYNAITTPDWWRVMVEADGNMFICKGNGFVNLQESNNYAYGSTRKEAKDNYRLLFTLTPAN